MKLGQAGEAFFVEKVKSCKEDVPYNLATSPIPSANFLTDDQFNFMTNVKCVILFSFYKIVYFAAVFLISKYYWYKKNLSSVF